MTTPQKVLEGEDGWLYLDHDKNRSVDQYLGKVELTEKTRAAWLSMLSGMSNLASQLGFQHVQIIAPSKESVYDSWYPHRDRRAAVRPVDALVAALPDETRTIFPVQELLQAGRMRVYDKGDTHWNDYGAYITVETTLKLLGLADALSIDDFDFIERRSSGDLDSKMEPRRSEFRITATARTPRAKRLFDSELRNRGRTLIYESPGAPLGSLVLFGDSFAWSLAIFLEQIFRRFVFIHSTSPDQSVIEKEKPDVVITECTERFVIEGPARLGKFRIEDVIRLKLARSSTEERMRIHRLYSEKAANSSEPFYSNLFLNAATEKSGSDGPTAMPRP